MIEVLKAFKGEIEKLGIEAEFFEWTQEVAYPYWVCDYLETPNGTEDNLELPTIILSGFSRSTALELEKEKQAVKDHFKLGVVTLTSKGTAIAIFYSKGGFVPTGDKDLKRIDIEFEIKKWSMNA